MTSWTTPEEHGAVGDGVTNDTSAFLTALGTGKPLQLGGAYNLSTWSQYTPPSKRVLKGMGNSRIILPGTTKFFKATQEIHLDDLGFEGGGSIVENVAADSGSPTQIKVTGCTFTGVRNPIALERPFERFSCTRSSFIDCTGDGIRCGKDDYALQDNWKRMSVVNCDCRNLAGFGANATRFILLYGRQATISDNTIDGITGITGEETHGIYTKTRYGTIKGNTIRDIKTGNVISGITLKGKYRGNTSDPQGFGCVVGTNTIDCNGACSYGIRVDSGDTTVTGNQITGASITGIDVASDLTSRMIVTGNLCYGEDLTGTTGIVSNTGGKSVMINSNLIEGYRKGIKLGAPDTDLENAMINSNIITDASTLGIEVSPVTGRIITRLQICQNIIQTTGSYDIRILNLPQIFDLMMENNINQID